MCMQLQPAGLVRSACAFKQGCAAGCVAPCHLTSDRPRPSDESLLCWRIRGSTQFGTALRRRSASSASITLQCCSSHAGRYQPKDSGGK